MKPHQSRQSELSLRLADEVLGQQNRLSHKTHDEDLWIRCQGTEISELPRHNTNGPHGCRYKVLTRQILSLDHSSHQAEGNSTSTYFLHQRKTYSSQQAPATALCSNLLPHGVSNAKRLHKMVHRPWFWCKVLGKERTYLLPLDKAKKMPSLAHNSSVSNCASENPALCPSGHTRTLFIWQIVAACILSTCRARCCGLAVGWGRQMFGEHTLYSLDDNLVLTGPRGTHTLAVTLRKHHKTKRRNIHCLQKLS